MCSHTDVRTPLVLPLYVSISFQQLHVSSARDSRILSRRTTNNVKAELWNNWIPVATSGYDQLSLCQWNELTPCRAQSKQYASLALGLQFPSGSPRNKGKYSLIAHPIAQVGLNKVLCTTATGIPSSFRAWILVHRLHVQECVSVHGFFGLLLTTTHFPKGASHGSCRASTQILQPQELWAEHSQKQFECGEVFVISLLNVRASFFLQSFCSPTPMVQLSVFSFLVFFSLTSNPPLLNHPPSSPFISQLLFLSPLSYQWHLVLIFALLFFLSPLLFSFLYIQVKFLFLRPPGSQAHLPAV